MEITEIYRPSPEETPSFADIPSVFILRNYTYNHR